MKFLPLLLANLTRRKIRTTLAMGSFFVALFLLGLLLAVRGAFNQGLDLAQADRLVVTNKTSMIQPLPYASKDKVARVPGIKAFTWANWFGGVYQDPKNFFVQFAIDTENWRAVYDEFVVPENQWQAFVADRQGDGRGSRNCSEKNRSENPSSALSAGARPGASPSSGAIRSLRIWV